MLKMIPPAVGTTLQSAHGLLQQAVTLLNEIARNTSPRPSVAKPETVLFMINQGQPSLDPPFARNIIVGGWCGADHSGRATINYGADGVPIWLFANYTTLIPTTSAPFLEFGGSPISFTPPAGTVNWDLVLMIESGGPAGKPRNSSV